MINSGEHKIVNNVIEIINDSRLENMFFFICSLKWLNRFFL